jgi:hypothetical protein
MLTDKRMDIGEQIRRSMRLYTNHKSLSYVATVAFLHFPDSYADLTQYTPCQYVR